MREIIKDLLTHCLDKYNRLFNNDIPLSKDKIEEKKLNQDLVLSLKVACSLNEEGLFNEVLNAFDNYMKMMDKYHKDCCKFNQLDI